MSVVGKVYGRILIMCVRKIIDEMISEEQCGFRIGRDCLDQVFLLRRVSEKARERERKVYVAFLDLGKVYDCVNRKGLWKVPQMHGLGGKLLNNIKSFCVNSKACVKIKSKSGDWFEAKGGYGMSSRLFNISMNRILREASMIFGGG